MKGAGRITCAILIVLAPLRIFSQEQSETAFGAGFVQEEPRILNLSSEEKAFIEAHPALNVVCEQQNAPFCYRTHYEDFIEYEGISISLLQLAASRLGVDLQIIPTKSDKESLDLFSHNMADIATWNIVDHADFSKSAPVFATNLYLVSRTNVKNTDSGKKKRLLVNMAQSKVPYRFYIEFPSSEYSYTFVENTQKAFTLFKKKRYNTVIVNQFALHFFSKTANWEAKNLNVPVQTQFSYSYLGKELTPLFDKAFSSLTQSDFDSIVQKNLMSWNSYTRQKSLANTIFHQTAFLTALIAFFLIVLATIIISLVARQKVHLIEYDEVTGMPAFTSFRHEVKKILKNAKPNEYMIISLNVKDFKYINYNFGFSKGNMILLELGQHFLDVAQEGELVCRYHADNFIFFSKTRSLIFIEDHVCALQDVSKKIRRYLPDRYNLRFTTSVYYIQDTSEDITNMIDKANLARKASSSSGRVVEYTEQMDELIEWNKKITLSMDNAFENHEFEVYYQPKISFADESIVGAEALIRWNSPQQGFLAPDKFVPLFEQNGFIQKIDLFVFETVCRFLVRWNHAALDGTCPHPLTISFNLSRSHLNNPLLLSELTGIKNRYDLFPSRIEVELTESILFDNPKRLIKIMKEIKAAGFSISVDDFGSGYSSLNLLKDIPADVLKLDKEFLSNVPGSQKESTIISSVIEMSKKLNLTIVAEGVETNSQVDLLRNMGCDIAQGYYYAHPIPESEYYDMLKTHYIKAPVEA